MKISVNAMFLISYLLVMLIPSYFTNAFTSLINNVLTATAVLWLCRKHYYPNKYTILIAAYYLIIIAVTFLNGNGTVHTIVYNLKFLVFISLIDAMYYRNEARVIEAAFMVVLFYTLIDVITIVCFPQGLYQTITYWNQWSWSETKCWFFGNKNNRIMWYLLLLLLATIRYKRGMGRVESVYAVILMSLTAILLTQSSTSIIVIGVMVITVLCMIHIKVEEIRINGYIILGICAIGTCLTIVGNVDFIAPIIKSVFGKEATFTGRSGIWLNVMGQIAQKPILGWGIQSSSKMAEVLDKASAVNAHNQWLQTLWQGGIIGLISLLTIFREYVRCLNRLSGDMAIMFAGVLLAVLIEMIFEVQMGFAFLLVLFFCFEEMES